MKRINHSLSILTVGGLVLSATPARAGEPAPEIAAQAVAAAPTVPQGRAIRCTDGPAAKVNTSTCPVVRYQGLTWWPLDHADSRDAVVFAGFDAGGKLVKSVERPGTRSVHSVVADPVAKTVTLVGKDGARVSIGWAELATARAGANIRWEKIPIPAVKPKQISVGSAAHVFMVDTTGITWKWNGTTWTKGKPAIATLSAAPDGALASSDATRVQRIDSAGTQSTTTLAAGMKQVVVAADKTYGLDAAGAHHRWDGARWQKQQGCCVAQLATSSDGALWARDTGRVMRWTGTAWTPATTLLPGGIKQFAVGSANQIWAVDPNDHVFQWSNNAWQPMPGALTSISASADGTVWGLDATHDVVRLTR
jgi:virginiamycin B lyase